MSRVFTAEETRLHRKLVAKVLSRACRRPRKNDEIRLWPQFGV